MLRFAASHRVNTDRISGESNRAANVVIDSGIWPASLSADRKCLTKVSEASFLAIEVAYIYGVAEERETTVCNANWTGFWRCMPI